jgi:hypothetical protein
MEKLELIPEGELTRRFGEDEPLLCQGVRNPLQTNHGLCTKLAGWGTTHTGVGACKLHGGEKRLDYHTKEEEYTIQIKHIRLKQLYEEEELRSNLGQLDDTDDMIMLVRALIRVIAEEFGQALVTGEDGIPRLEQTIDPGVLRGQVGDIVHMIDRLSASIKRKYEILQLAGESIPREKVRAYVTRIQLILNQVLRDSCSECGHVHNMRDNAIKSLFVLGDL